MDKITDSNDTPKRRLEDHHPAAKIAWDKPGAPAVPAPAAARCAPMRAVASMSVSDEGISIFPTPAAKELARGHYMLSLPEAQAIAAFDGADLARAAEAAQPASTDAELAKLKALALAATPGPWDYREADGISAIAHPEGWLLESGDEQECADKRYIAAASPAVVLDLIARIGNLQKACDIMRQALCEISQPADEGRSHKADADDMRETAIDALSEAESVIDFGETLAERVSVAANPHRLQLSELEKALRELMSIVRIHSADVGENFAWAEMGYAEEALSILATKPAVPEGWKLVPIEPTQEMWKAGETALNADCYPSGIYKDMLAAAPAAPMASADAVIEAREQALEDAALACEAWGEAKIVKWQDVPDMHEDAKARAWDALQCAVAVRALKRTAAGAEGAAS